MEKVVLIFHALLDHISMGIHVYALIYIMSVSHGKSLMGKNVYFHQNIARKAPDGTEKIVFQMDPAPKVFIKEQKKMLENVLQCPKGAYPLLPGPIINASHIRTALTKPLKTINLNVSLIVVV